MAKFSSQKELIKYEVFPNTSPLDERSQYECVCIWWCYVYGDINVKRHYFLDLHYVITCDIL